MGSVFCRKGSFSQAQTYRLGFYLVPYEPFFDVTQFKLPSYASYQLMSVLKLDRWLKPDGMVFYDMNYRSVVKQVRV
ncbi:hypothetical protein KAM461_29710 [Aeromonas hydrophila]|nr:hypothetical protein KAM461_29710 [Aeromonas hydrophila]